MSDWAGIRFWLCRQPWYWWVSVGWLAGSIVLSVVLNH